LTEAWKEYNKNRQNAKRVIFSAKEKKQKECATDLNDTEHQNEILNDTEHQNEIFQMANQMVKERIYQGQTV